MESPTPSNALKSDKNATKKKLLMAGAAAVGLLVVLALGLALFFDANQFRSQLEQTMGEALGRKVTMGSIRVAMNKPKTRRRPGNRRNVNA